MEEEIGTADLPENTANEKEINLNWFEEYKNNINYIPKGDEAVFWFNSKRMLDKGLITAKKEISTLKAENERLLADYNLLLQDYAKNNAELKKQLSQAIPKEKIEKICHWINDCPTTSAMILERLQKELSLTEPSSVSAVSTKQEGGEDEKTT